MKKRLIDMKKTENDLINELEEPRKAIVKFLKKHGWKIFLVGDTGVVRNPNNPLKYNYWFTMSFVGGKKGCIEKENEKT
jgi:hypothetical protein